MKKRIVSRLGLTALFATALLLSGCGGGGSDEPTPAPEKPSPAASSAAPAAESKTLTVTLTNSSDYIFNELYVSPSASENWGSDHLGSTNILKRGGSYDISLEKYDYNNYDIRVVDEDDDEYIFKFVALENGTTVEISFDNGLQALVSNSAGEELVIDGELLSAGGYEEETYLFDFTIYNESEYDIYAIYVMPAYMDGEAIDILPSVLAGGDSYEVYEEMDGGYADVDEWNLHIVDVDGDENTYYEVFDPWTLSYVDIYWDNNSGGYVCEYSY